MINAWRIDVADEEATLDILSTVYQMGFRLSSLVGGALALIIAARIGWPQTYVHHGRHPAGDRRRRACSRPIADRGRQRRGDRERGRRCRAAPAGRAVAAGPQLALLARRAAVGLGASARVLVFMVRSMTAAPENRPDPTEFTATYGPLIVIATIVLPALIAGWLAEQQREGRTC